MITLLSAINNNIMSQSLIWYYKLHVGSHIITVQNLLNFSPTSKFESTHIAYDECNGNVLVLSGVASLIRLMLGVLKQQFLIHFWGDHTLLSLITETTYSGTWNHTDTIGTLPNCPYYIEVSLVRMLCKLHRGSPASLKLLRQQRKAQRAQRRLGREWYLDTWRFSLVN